MTTLADYVHAFAAPFLRFGEARDAIAARDRLATLYSATSADELAKVFAWFASFGFRREWASYEAHAGGAWIPDVRDRTVARKAAFTIAHREQMKGRGLVALDAARACTLAEWALLAGLYDEPRAVAAVSAVTALAIREHRSWTDFAQQLRFGLEWAEGSVESELESILVAIASATGAPPWPTEVPAAPPVTDAETAGARTIVVAVGVALDCAGCEHALFAPGLVSHARCHHCGTDLALAAADWGYLLERHVAQVRGGGQGEISNADFGDRYFSRITVRRVDAPACACGAVVPLASLHTTTACACGRGIVVSPADERARAVDSRVRSVVSWGAKRVDPDATFACAACGASQPLGCDPARIRRCSACGVRTFVADAAHARSFDPPRRPVFHLVLD